MPLYLFSLLFYFILFYFAQGVALSHGNLIASVGGMTHSIKFYSSDMWVLSCITCIISLPFNRGITCYSFDSYISYLPLAHIYERANQILGAYYGVAVGFYQGVCHSYMADLFLLGICLYTWGYSWFCYGSFYMFTCMTWIKKTNIWNLMLENNLLP